jgi:hypothetical protein
MAAEIIQIDTQDFTSQTYGGQDTNLISTFDLSTSFTTSSYIESFIYDNNRNIITFDYNFTDYTIQNDGQSAGSNGNVSQITVNPEQFLIDNGFDQGEYITYFNFFNKKIGSELQPLYIAEISSDRTEIRLDSTTLSNLDIVEQTTQFVQERETSTYFLDFYLNFGDNQLSIANNIRLDNTDPNNPTVLVKLYEPLLEEFDVNFTLWVVTTLEEPIAYQVIFEDEPIVFVDFENISGPNFNIDLKDRVNNSTQNVSYTDLITTSLTSSTQQLNSLLEEKEIDVNVDYTSFENFIHFSSAQTRLENFYFKIQLIEQYSSSIAILNNATNSSSSINNSKTIYESKINNIITNFDGYEYFLYYESSSYAWPKTNSQKPYELAKSDSTTVLTWIGSADESNSYFGGLLYTSSLYDNENKDNLYFSIPEYLREDPNNDQYLLFIDMVGQFYDNIWIYYKEVTQKYNADNRLEYGVSKDIVADAIRDFGIKLYQNNFSNEDLYTAFLGITPEGGLFPFPNITGSLPTPSGFEYVNTLISASNDYIPLDDVNKSLYKRIYHNLPYLLKAKGTLPGLRALITSYGIPDTILRINEYGGKDKIDSNDWDYWQNEFNYSFYTEGNNFISSSFAPINSSWNATSGPPESLMFRFKSTLSPDYDPSSSLLVWNNVVSNWNSTPYLWNVNVPSPYSQSLWSKQFNAAHITLTYTGSGYASGSYSGSVIDPYYQYATLTLYPSYTNNPTVSASVYLPFFDGGWWSVMVNVDTTSTPNYRFTLYAANKIYEGGDNGTLLGFIASSSIIADGANWDNNGNCYFASSSLVNGTQYNAFSGSLQEIRYYTNPISESVFRDYTMNPSSIEGNSINSSPNELLFRASLGGELYTGSTSIHPKITGSWATTQSFASSSNFYFDQTPIFIPNREYFFYDQPIAGIKNTISDKIRIENNVLPEGNTLSPFKSLSQMANISQSYTQNINYLEVAFSPQNEINEDIMDQIGSFNIGEYIGDPRLRSSSAESYPALDQLRNEYFQKYTSNYNLTDFIRLIKFFDNSLFKMIRDFVPARTSLASGIVIKQHLLERNKYPQPQLEWEDLDISGTLKPTWNDYEPGTVENFSGGTGGTMDVFNSILNTSQSWYENIPTISGSVLVLHNSQDEFYDGEFSGSNIIVTTQSLNIPYPIENLSFDYTPVRYSPQNYGLSSDSRFAEDQFLNSLTTPNQGEILLLRAWKDFSVIPSRAGLIYVKIHKIDNNGIDNSTALGQATQLLIKYSTLNPYYTLKILSVNEYPTYYLYQVNTLGSDTVDNYILDYNVSASSAATIAPVLNPLTFTSYGNVFGNTLGYFDNTTGIHTLGNTPNIPLSITGSVSVGGIGGTGIFSLNLLRQGNTSTLSSISVSTGNSYSISSSYYGLQGDQIYLQGSNTGGVISYFSGSLLITQSTAPSAAENDPIIIEPYVTTPNFYNSDGNALLNNAFELRDSSYYMDVDYSAGLTEPVNFDSIISESATRAKVQDSNYTSKRVVIPRYLGSKSTSQQLNAWTPNDTGTYGKLPTIESLKSFVAYGYMDGSYAPERMNTSVFRIKYLIDQDGNISAPNISDVSLPTVQQNFPTGDRFRYASILGLSSGGGIENQFRNIIRGGYRIEPILYTQYGSAPSATWNTTMSFQDIIPSDAGAVGNYTALFKKLSQNLSSPGTENLVTFNTATYGGTYLNSNGYRVPLNAIQDGVNLIFDINLNITTVVSYFGSPLALYGGEGQTHVVSIKNTTTNTEIATTTVDIGTGNIDLQITVNNAQLNVNDTYKVYITWYNSNPGAYAFPTFTSTINPNNSYFKVSQYPLYTQPITSSGTNTIWGYPNSGSYPYVITSSNQTLVELYNSNVKQTDITGSGFNPIELPWSIKYGDEFRFEGREDFTYTVGKIFSPAESGSGRIFQTGSIEVHFDKNLPISASTSAFNLDHFLIRRYVEDSSLIIFEGFRPTGGGNPNSFIITPEYVIPQLNKNTDEFVTLLTEKGLIG